MNLISGGHRSSISKKSITYYGATNHSKSLYQFVNRYMFNEPLNIQRKMLSTGLKNHPNATAAKHWIVIHDTANTNASALANHNYMLGGASNQYVSWHYTTGNQTFYARWKKVETPPAPQFAVPTIHRKYTTLNPAYTAGRKITVRGVVVHSTAVAGVMAGQWFSRWNRTGISVGVHTAVDNKEAWQYLPWNHRGWHGGGSSNDTHIGMEICEPAGHYYSGSTMVNYNVAAQTAYFNATYSNAVGLVAYLLKMYGLTVTTYTVIGHNELAARGMGTASADPMQWFPKHGKSMATFRADVTATLRRL